MRARASSSAAMQSFVSFSAALFMQLAVAVQCWMGEFQRRAVNAVASQYLSRAVGASGWSRDGALLLTLWINGARENFSHFHWASVVQNWGSVTATVSDGRHSWFLCIQNSAILHLLRCLFIKSSHKSVYTAAFWEINSYDLSHGACGASELEYLSMY